MVRQTGTRWSYYWSDVSSSQGNRRIASKYQKLDEVWKFPPLCPSEEAWPRPHLDFGLLTSETKR